MNYNNDQLFCTDLTSSPQTEKGIILVTGATGYIGGRLIPELLARGYRVRVMVRVSSPEQEARWPGAEIVVADARDIESWGEDIQLVEEWFFVQSEFIENFSFGHRIMFKISGLFPIANKAHRILIYKL